MSSSIYIDESTPSKVECNRIVLALVGNPILAEAWWNGPNLAFGMQAPITQPLDRVYNYLTQFI